MNSGKSWLCAELMRTKSGYSDWAVNPKTIWPQWSWERLGALAMTSDPKVGEVSTFAAIGAYYEAIGAFGFIDSEPDNRDAVVGEIAVRLGVKPWEMGHFRHRYTNGVEDFALINLRALTRLGAVKNEADLLVWSLKSDGVDGDPT